MSLEILNGVLESGCWGTIGPYSIKAAAAAASYCGAKHCLITHSAQTAYESALRSLGAARGDFILTAAYGTPFLSLTTILTGASPLFCGAAEDKIVSAETIRAFVEKNKNINIRAAAFDYDSFAPASIPEISAIFKNRNISFIIYLGGDILKAREKTALALFADAVILDFGEGSAVYAGNGGAVLCDGDSMFEGAFAAHNCGRSVGEGATLDIEGIIGGDFRVTEWQAALISEGFEALEKGENPEPQKSASVLKKRVMRESAFFTGGYYKKMTASQR